MFVASLTDAELETLIVALKYWRHHRRETRGRRQDRVLPPLGVDVLLAKLTAGVTIADPHDDLPTDLLKR